MLPWLTFAMLYAALYARMIRASVIETMDEDYVRTARAKGASGGQVLRSHVLRNAMLPVVTMLGMDVGYWMANVLFIETVFSLPGVGRLLTQSLARRDLPVLMAIMVIVRVTDRHPESRRRRRVRHARPAGAVRNRAQPAEGTAVSRRRHSGELGRAAGLGREASQAAQALS